MKLVALGHRYWRLPQGDSMELYVKFQQEPFKVVAVEPPHNAVCVARALRRMAALLDVSSELHTSGYRHGD